MKIELRNVSYKQKAFRGNFCLFLNKYLVTKDLKLNEPHFDTALQIYQGKNA